MRDEEGCDVGHFQIALKLIVTGIQCKTLKKVTTLNILMVTERVECIFCDNYSYKCLNLFIINKLEALF